MCSGSPECGSNLFESGYNAGVAYDQASGLGSVDITQLIDNWNKATFDDTDTVLTINGATGAITSVHGQPITFNVNVSGNGVTPQPTGSVALISNANQGAATYNSNGLGFFPLTNGSNGNGTTGPVSYTNLPGGSYTVYGKLRRRHPVRSKPIQQYSGDGRQREQRSGFVRPRGCSERFQYPHFNLWQLPLRDRLQRGRPADRRFAGDFSDSRTGDWIRCVRRYCWGFPWRSLRNGTDRQQRSCRATGLLLVDGGALRLRKLCG